MPISRILAAAFAATLTGALCPSALAVPTQEVQKILASDAAAGDRFGYSVSVDGDTAVVGAQCSMTTEAEIADQPTST